MRVKMEDGSTKDHLLGVHTATNHHSETQLEGWKTCTMDLADYHRKIYGPDGGKTMAARDFAIKTVGANSDHSGDQKKLWRLYADWKDDCDTRKRGEQAVLSMVPSELLPLLMDVSDKTIRDAGGLLG